MYFFFFIKRTLKKTRVNFYNVQTKLVWKSVNFDENFFCQENCFTYTSTYKPCYLINPDDDDKPISTFRNYELDPITVQYCRNPGCHRICWKSLLAESACLTLHDHRTSEKQIERLAAILCLLAKGWGRRCSGL